MLVEIDIDKESLAALKHIDYARVRSYCVQRLLTYELADTSYFLTKDEFLRKPEKSELVREIEKKVNIASNSTIPSLDNENIDGVIVINFMAYSRRVPIKKLKLTSFNDYFRFLLRTFQQLSKQSTRIDIVFDLYLKDSVK